MLFIAAPAEAVKIALRGTREFPYPVLVSGALAAGTVMAVAVPSYQAIQPGMRLNGAAREVLGKLMWARAKAVEQNSTYAVNFPTDHTFQIFNDANGNNSVDAGEWSQTIDIQTDYTSVTLSSNVATVSFSSRGTGVAATITITNTTGSKTVIVVATGNVKIS